MSVTKRVRITPGEAEQLAILAADSGKTESEILREGILLFDRARRREAAWDDLIALAERDKDTEWTKAGGFR